MNTGGFTRREVSGVAFYTCRTLEGLPRVRHAFSTRAGGRSALPQDALNLGAVGWDDMAAVRENRRRFLTAAGFGTLPLATLVQIHSDRIHIIEDLRGGENARPEGDALVTGCSSIVIAVQVADCFPILMAGAECGAVAAVHAGWRGTAGRIAPKTLACMQREFGTDAAHAVVAIGPGIRKCCFEAGPEVVARFEAEFPDIHLHAPSPRGGSRAMLDLPRALRLQLLEAGVNADNIHDLGLCTRCNTGEFFSYRGEGPQSGRMMGAIALVAPA